MRGGGRPAHNVPAAQDTGRPRPTKRHLFFRHRNGEPEPKTTVYAAGARSVPEYHARRHRVDFGVGDWRRAAQVHVAGRLSKPLSHKEVAARVRAAATPDGAPNSITGHAAVGAFGGCALHVGLPSAEKPRQELAHALHFNGDVCAELVCENGGDAPRKRMNAMWARAGGTFWNALG